MVGSIDNMLLSNNDIDTLIYRINSPAERKFININEFHNILVQVEDLVDKNDINTLLNKYESLPGLLGLFLSNKLLNKCQIYKLGKKKAPLIYMYGD